MILPQVKVLMAGAGGRRWSLESVSASLRPDSPEARSGRQSIMWFEEKKPWIRWRISRCICTIYVLSFSPPLNGQKLCLKVRPGDTVLSLKQKIRDSENIPPERQCLIIRGRQLMDGKRLYESNVFDGATLQLCV